MIAVGIDEGIDAVALAETLATESLVAHCRRRNFEGAGYKILGFEPRFVWQPPFGDYDAEVNR